MIARRKRFRYSSKRRGVERFLPSPTASEFLENGCLIRRKYSRTACQVILHRVREHNSQPEKACESGKPDKLGAPVNVHEKEHNARHLGERDQQGDERVRTRENKVEIDRRDGVRQDRADDKYSENAEIARNADMLMLAVVNVVVFFVCHFLLD